MVVRDCLGRTPFGSLIATLLCLCGVGIFCACLYEAIQITVIEIFEGLFYISLPWLDTIKVLFVIIAVFMGVYAVLILVFGFLATGATRQNIYSGARCIMGGRCAAAFFMVVTYILNITWVLISSTCAIPIILYVMLNSICDYEVRGRDPWYFDEYYCFNLSRFGIYINYTEVTRKNALCEDYELGDLCDHVHNAGPMYGLAFGGSLLIVLAMVMFMVIMATNYQHIKMSKEMTEYRDAVDMELSETRVFGGSANSKMSLT